MDLTAIWYIAAFCLVIVEMLTGTYFLLILAAGLTSAGTVSMLGGQLIDQVGTTLLVSVIGLVVLYVCHKTQSKASVSPVENPEVFINIGMTITVPCWNQDRTARITYRGTPWNARLERDVSSKFFQPGIFRISSIQDATLILVP